MGLIDTDGLNFGTGLSWLTGGIGQGGLIITSSTSGAALFLAEWGPYGMAMDFTDASIAIDGSTGVLDYNSQGTVSSTGELLGPGSKLTYSAPSVKFTEQADGYIAGQKHNLYANSEAPANQSVTTGMVTGGSYAITLTGSVSITLSGAATGTITAGTTTFTAASGTLTCGSTSGSGTVHLRRTPSVSTYVKTPTVLGATTGFDLPYVYSGGLKTGILDELAATNLALWGSNLEITHALTVTGGSGTFTDGETVTATGGGTGVYQSSTSTSTVFTLRTGSGTFTGTLTGGTSGATRTISSAALIWTPSNLTTAKTATGPDGVANSASTLTATAGNATALQAITSASSSRLTSVYIKRRTGTGNIDLTQDNGSTWTTVTVTSAWTRVSIVAVTSTNPTVGIRIVTSGDEVDVYAFQHETGTVVTSPIITYAAAVTRAVDTFYILTNLFPSSITTFSVYGNYVLPSPSFGFPCPFTVYQSTNTTGNRAQIFHGPAGANYTSTFRVNASLGGTAISASAGSAFAPLTSAKAMFAVEAGSNAACINGGTVATDASAVVFADLDRLSLSQAGGLQPNGLIKSIAYFPERKADATLQTMTTA